MSHGDREKLKMNEDPEKARSQRLKKRLQNSINDDEEDLVGMMSKIVCNL